MKMPPSQHYWSDAPQNDHGETLEQCKEKYGTHLVTSVEKNMRYKVVFLSPKKDLSHSFLLWIQRIQDDHKFIPASMYESSNDVYIRSGCI